MNDLLRTRPDVGFTFDRAPTPLEPENRPIWRIALIALILMQLGRAGKASSQKLLVLSSLVSSKHKRALLTAVLGKRARASALNIRFDPSVNRAIDFGIAEGLFNLDKNKNVCLSPKGSEFAERVREAEGVFSLEKEFIDQFSKQQFSEKAIQSLLTD